MTRRVRQRRTKGWRKPHGARSVVRGTRWGNPYPVRDYGRDEAIRLFTRDLEADQLYTQPGKPPVTRAEVRRELAGKTLMCWCKPHDACHADVLLRIANPDART